MLRPVPTENSEISEKSAMTADRAEAAIQKTTLPRTKRADAASQRTTSLLAGPLACRSLAERLLESGCRASNESVLHPQ